MIDKEMRKMITESASVEEMKQYAIRKQEMNTLKQSAIRYLKDGMTSVEEVVKVAYYEE